MVPTNLPAKLVPLIINQDGYFPSGILKKDLNNFGPRVGVVYSANDTTVIRSGFGIIYAQSNALTNGMELGGNSLQATRVASRILQEWQVSLAALLMRAKTLGRMTESNYLTAVKALSARGWRRLEPVPLGPPEHPTRLRHIVDANDSNGVCKALPHDVVGAIVGANAA